MNKTPEKPVILLVEDNLPILEELQLLLEFSHYEVITATNGKKALDRLRNSEIIPNLIISDIMMPEMDGYELFKRVSTNSRWYHIPFLFLTALSSPNDIRLGKMLGVDDYIIKPFKEEDLLASIAGKLLKSKKLQFLNNTITDFPMRDEKESKTQVETQDQHILFFVNWDEVMGPIIEKQFPTSLSKSISLIDVGTQLYQATSTIYGYNNYEDPEGLLINIKNIGQTGYLYFDSYTDTTVRGNQRQYMISVLAPIITYFQSLKIKQILAEISSYIKTSKTWDIEFYWNNLHHIFQN